MFGLTQNSWGYSQSKTMYSSDDMNSLLTDKQYKFCGTSEDKRDENAEQCTCDDIFIANFWEDYDPGMCEYCEKQQTNLDIIDRKERQKCYSNSQLEDIHGLFGEGFSLDSEDDEMGNWVIPEVDKNTVEGININKGNQGQMQSTEEDADMDIIFCDEHSTDHSHTEEHTDEPQTANTSESENEQVVPHITHGTNMEDSDNEDSENEKDSSDGDDDGDDVDSVEDIDDESDDPEWKDPAYYANSKAFNISHLKNQYGSGRDHLDRRHIPSRIHNQYQIDDGYEFTGFITGNGKLTVTKSYKFPRVMPAEIIEIVEFWEVDYQVGNYIVPRMGLWDSKGLTPKEENNHSDYSMYNAYKSLYNKWIKCNCSLDQWYDRYGYMSLQTVLNCHKKGTKRKSWFERPSSGSSDSHISRKKRPCFKRS